MQAQKMGHGRRRALRSWTVERERRACDFSTALMYCSIDQLSRNGCHEVVNLLWTGRSRRAIAEVSESALGAILDFLMPRHLDRFQLAFVRGFGIAGKVRQFSDVAVQ